MFISGHDGENLAVEPGGLRSMVESVNGKGLRLSPVKIANGGELARDRATSG